MKKAVTSVTAIYALQCKASSLRERIDLLRKTRLFACRVVLVIDMVRGSLVNRLAGRMQEGRRFIRVSSGNRVEHLAGRFLDARLLGHVLRMTLRIGLNT